MPTNDIIDNRTEKLSKMMLVRAIVDDRVDPAVVVTAYRTNKIGKYWRQP